ncbi:hypothetical protein TorRG33x02_067790 [Trema orientale]|uniref:Transmembrane protein n=1 Tax=Trema orientale TaxID=63057 RepID=A0A2P5FHQ9_TREOI|nr:hypothetical protein TorRG33x02_067790 [Trema orientale]
MTWNSTRLFSTNHPGLEYICCLYTLLFLLVLFLAFSD